MGIIGQTLRWVGMPLFLGMTTHGAPLAAVAIPFTIPPIAYLLYWRNSLPIIHQADVDTLTYIFFGSGTLGLTAMVIGQTAISLGVSYLLFGKDLAMKYIAEFQRTSVIDLPTAKIEERASMAKDWRYYVLLAAFCYVGAGGLEELLKYFPVALLRRRGVKPTKEIYVQYASAAALGFATIEVLLYTRAAVKSGEPILKIIRLIAERVITGLPGHTMTAVLAALNAAKLGDYDNTPSNLWKILQAPLLYHGTFDMFLFVLSALHGNIGWIHPENPWTITGGFATIGAIQAGLYHHVWQAWQALSVNA